MSHDALHHEYTAKRLAELAQESAKRADFNEDRVLKEVAAIALFDPRKLFNDDGQPKQISELDDATAAAISSIKTVKTGEESSVVEYKVNDKNQALEKLMRHLGLYQQDNEQQNTSLAAALEAGIKRARNLSE
jgi:phage terminase small subunit